jgi:polar amino acid transport system ATP-binding protein
LNAQPEPPTNSPTSSSSAPEDSAPEPAANGDARPIVEFDKVTKQFGDNTVCRELCFSVQPNEHITLIGPSGSGKTTILRLLMTLEHPNGGVIWVDGEPLWHQRRGDRLVPADQRHLREMRKQIGMVFQQFNLFPNMRVLRNVTEAPIYSLGVPKDKAEQRARELLDMVGLGDKLDHYPSQLSGGQQQRVAIARALAMNPKILLLDEVTSALDPELVAGVLGILRDIATTMDLTILCVTHEMGFARDISHRVLMFDQGQIVESGPPDKIFTDPDHERTRTFLHAVIEAR